MHTHSKTKKIGIFGHYGNLNLGDESIINAVIKNIKKRLPNAELYGFSINPQDTFQRHQITSYPIRRLPKSASPSPPAQCAHTSPCISTSREKGTTSVNNIEYLKNFVRKVPLLLPLIKLIKIPLEFFFTIVSEAKFLLKAYRILKPIDLLLITGSNQFLDNFGGPWGFPYTLLKWSILAKLTSTKLYYVSVGAGPISHKLSMIFFHWALYFSNYVSLRDFSSEQLIKKTGYKGKTYVYPDLAHSLPIKHIKSIPIVPAGQINNHPIIGINPMPLYDPRYWCVHDENKYLNYIQKLADFSEIIIQKKYPLFYFATQKRDNDVIQDILALLKKKDIAPDYKYNLHHLDSKSVDELIANILTADIIVATRFHGTVLSLLAERPILGICYYRKAKDLMVEMGQGDYTVNLDNFTVEELLERFKILEKNKEIEKIKINLCNKKYLSSLDMQYDNLLVDDFL